MGGGVGGVGGVVGGVVGGAVGAVGGAVGGVVGVVGGAVGGGVVGGSRPDHRRTASTGELDPAMTVAVSVTDAVISWFFVAMLFLSDVQPRCKKILFKVDSLAQHGLRALVLAFNWVLGSRKDWYLRLLPVFSAMNIIGYVLVSRATLTPAAVAVVLLGSIWFPGWFIYTYRKADESFQHIFEQTDSLTLSDLVRIDLFMRTRAVFTVFTVLNLLLGDYSVRGLIGRILLVPLLAAVYGSHLPGGPRKRIRDRIKAAMDSARDRLPARNPGLAPLPV